MKRTALVVLTLLTMHVFGQDNPTEQAQPIVEEGKRLYRAEMATWNSLQIFLDNYKGWTEISGHLSYTDNALAKCVYFTEENNKLRVIGTVSFDSTYNVKNATVDLTEREFTAGERDLYEIRKIAIATLKADKYTALNPSGFGLIPLIYGGEKKVYAIYEAPLKEFFSLGNDYLLTFDNNNNLISKQQLHKNTIRIRSKRSMHFHDPETGDFITATDICALMLHEKIGNWEQHKVISKNYVSIWNCVTNQLVVIPK